MTAPAEQLVIRLRTTFESGRTRDLDWRRDQPRALALATMLTDDEDALPLLDVTRLLPFGVGRRIGTKMGADHVFMDAPDRPERSSYEATGKDDR